MPQIKEIYEYIDTMQRVGRPLKEIGEEIGQHFNLPWETAMELFLQYVQDVYMWNG